MVDLNLLKKIREDTGVSFSMCKKALEETNNNYDEAVKFLRKEGQAKAISRSDRAVSEGLCCILKDKTAVSCIKVGCETDFVSRNENFQKLVSLIAETALKTKSKSVDELLQQKVSDKTIKEIIIENISSIGENIVLSDVKTYELNPEENVHYYVHNSISGNRNIGRIVSFTISKGSDSENASLLLNQINMHIAAMSPIALDEKSIPDSVVNNEKSIYEEQVSKLNKPKEIEAKMIEGKLKKFYEENVLLKQTFVIDNKSTVEEAILAFNKTNNSNIKLLSFTRFSI